MNAQNPFEIVPISYGIERNLNGIEPFKLEIKSNQVDFQFTIAWVNQHEIDLKNALPENLTYSALYHLSDAESVLLEKTYLLEDLSSPQSLVIKDESSNTHYVIPIPVAFKISELDVDSPGSDTQEFIELISPALPYSSLNGLEVWSINGNTDLVSKEFSLSETVLKSNEEGLFLLSGRDLVVASSMEDHLLRSSTNLFQNGSSSSDEADAVALVWQINDLDQHIFLDAIIYDVGRVGTDQGLALLLDMNANAVTEGANQSKDEVSIHREISAWGPLKSPLSYIENVPSPGEARYMELQGQKGHNKWFMLGLPERHTFDSWLNQSLYTQGAVGADIEEGDPLIFTWHEHQFLPISDMSETLSPGLGSFIYVTEDTYGYGYDGWPKNLAVDQNIPAFEQYASYSIPLSTQQDGLNLLSNPYPFPIKLDAELENDAALHSISVWNGDTKQYEVWNGLAGDLNPPIIPAFGGFWLKVNQDSELTFNQSMRYTNNPAQKKHQPSPNNQIAILLKADQLEQRVIFQLTESENQPTDANSIEFLQMQADQPLSMSVSEDQNDEIQFKLLTLSMNDFLERDFYLNLEKTVDQMNDLILSIDQKFSSTNLLDMTLDLTDSNGLSSLKVNQEHLFEFAEQQTIQIKWRRPTTTSITEMDLIKRPKLLQNYPNPFNPSTQIQFELNTTAIIQLELYDLQGRLVDRIMNQRKSKGYHQFTYTMNTNLSSGVYLLRLYANNQLVDYQKILFMK